MAKVRPATAADIPAMIEMGWAMHQEAPRYRSMQYDRAKLHALCTALLEPGGMFVAEEDGRLVGMALVVIGERWFSADRYITDLVVYVAPEQRGGRAFLRLILAVEGWARAHGMDLDIDIGVSTGVTTEQTVRAYERMGYTLLPTRIVTKRISHVHRG